MKKAGRWSSRIAGRLVLYSVLSLAVFAVIAGLLFYSLITTQNTENTKSTLMQKAESIASSYSVFTEDYGEGSGGSGHGHQEQEKDGKGAGYSAYSRLVSGITDSEVWLVDQDYQLVVPEHDGSQTFSYEPLPEGAESIVKTAFAGQSNAAEIYSEKLVTETVTAGAPVTSADGTIQAVILVNSAVQGITDASNVTLKVLGISFLAALAAGLLCAVILSRNFTRPLVKMEKQAHALAEGDFTAQSGVNRRDEFGTLADSLDELAVKLKLSAEEQQRYQQMQQDFFSQISHELKTPVTVLSGSLELLSQGIVTEPEEVAACHQELYEESLGLKRLVSDLLELSRLGNTDFSLNMEPVNVCDIAGDAARAAARLGRNKHISIDYQTDNPVYILTGDYARLRQMLMAVLDNAIKFSPEGAAVKVRKSKNEITVCDQGPGIPEEDIPRIFERFWKTGGKANPSGTGLGLAIVKSIADRHGIEIIVESNAEGTNFRFILPEKQAES